jgi:hypothetical protein
LLSNNPLFFASNTKTASPGELNFTAKGSFPSPVIKLPTKELKMVKMEIARSTNTSSWIMPIEIEKILIPLLLTSGSPPPFFR